MGLFDELGKQVLGNVLVGTATGPSGDINWVQLGVAVLDKFGGIDGLIKRFTDKGLGDVISSWVGLGQNLPITADQILAVLGQRNVAEVAAEVGTDAGTAADGLARVLPSVIDKLTPQGESIAGDLLTQGVQSLLSGKMGDLGKLFS